MKHVQSALGAHQDAVIARMAARDIGVQAHLAGENAFSFGLLHERAHRQAIACEDQAQHAWRRAQQQEVPRLAAEVMTRALRPARKRPPPRHQ